MKKDPNISKPEAKRKKREITAHPNPAPGKKGEGKRGKNSLFEFEATDPKGGTRGREMT